jgi:putative Ca2+/H+ antiporter (TMEM165/GDT1 family)
LGETNGIEPSVRPGGKARCPLEFACRPAPEFFMEALFTSTAVVALAEIGDKTQLLAILLATRFNRPLPIILGILVATIANHALAALIGAQAAALLDSEIFRYVIGLSFVAMAAWTLIPDKFEDDEAPKPRFGAFLTTLVAFFLVEMGDKTQVATIALGAQYQDVIAVTCGTTLGMMIANVPAIFLGQQLLKRVDLGKVRLIAAALFLIIGLWVLAQTAGLIGG